MRNDVGRSIVSLIALFCTLVPCCAESAERQNHQTQPESSKRVPQTQSEITLSFAPVVKQTAPAVVNIYTKKVVEQRLSPFAGDPFFEKFFSDMFPGGRTRNRVENSLGSGVILDPGGIVVSNHHVVGEADEITVVLQDRREFRGRVLLSDEESDIAIVELEGVNDLPTLSLRDSDTLEVGDLVLAIGNPFGVGQTVTSGIISGVARSRGSRGKGTGVFIQTDAAINPGNSGGALVDMEGKLVGINTAILSRSGGSNGIGFAVPANLVAAVVKQARSGSEVLVRPWLGLDGQEVTGELASALGLDVPRGMVVEELHSSSVLAAGGLMTGDVILAIDGDDVNTLQEVEFRIATLGVGEEIRVEYWREGHADSIRAILMEAPEIPSRDLRKLGLKQGLPGLSVLNVNPGVIEEFDLPLAATGVLVLQTEGPARRVGVRRGDFIREVDGQRVNTVEELVSALSRTQGDTVVKIERRGRTGNIQYRR